MNKKKFEEICAKLTELYVQKDTRYGGSFHKQFETFGINSAVMRLGDKYERIKTLVQTTPEDCYDESIVDTLMDLANYSILTLMELSDEPSLNEEFQKESEE